MFGHRPRAAGRLMGKSYLAKRRHHHPGRETQPSMPSVPPTCRHDTPQKETNKPHEKCLKCVTKKSKKRTKTTKEVWDRKRITHLSAWKKETRHYITNKPLNKWQRGCTDIGCSLEHEVLMTGTTADRTASSTRGLRRPDDPSPVKYEAAGPGWETQTSRGHYRKQKGFEDAFTCGCVPCSAPWRARDNRCGMMTSWKHRPVSSVSGTFSAILWRLRHASTISSNEKLALPENKKRPCPSRETHFGLDFCTVSVAGRLPVCAELSTSKRTGALCWTTLGCMDIAAKADKHRWRTAWWQRGPEAALCSSPCSMGSEKARRRGGRKVGRRFHC